MTSEKRSLVGRVLFGAKGRKPPLSQKAVAEMRRAGMSNYVIAQGLFGGPTDVPASYNREQATRNVDEYLRTGKFMHQRWTDMDLSKLPSVLRAPAQSLGWRAPENDKRVAVLVAWLGGAKKERLGFHLKASYWDALDPTKAPGMRQRVFEDFVKDTGSWTIGGGEKYWHVLRIGRTAKLVEAGSNIEGVVKSASQHFEQAEQQRRRILLQQMNLNATHKTLASTAQSREAIESARRAQLAARELQGRLKMQSELMPNMKAGLPQDKLRQTIVQRTGELESYLQEVKARGADPLTVAELEKQIRQMYDSASNPQFLAGMKQEVVADQMEGVGMKLLELITPSQFMNMYKEKITEQTTPEQAKTAFLRFATQKAARIMADIHAVDKDEQLAKLTQEVQTAPPVRLPSGVEVAVAVPNWDARTVRVGVVGSVFQWLAGFFGSSTRNPLTGRAFVTQ